MRGDDTDLPTQAALETQQPSLSTGELHWQEQRQAWLTGSGKADNMDDVTSLPSDRCWDLRN